MLLMALSVGVSAQDEPAAPTPGAAPAAAARSGGKSKPKPYAEVITEKAVTRVGLFKVHQIDEKYYFEIPDSILGRDILCVNRISKGPAGVRSGFFGYAGDEIGQNVIRFEKGPNDKVFIRKISYSEYAPDSSSAMFASVSNSNLQPIAEAFDVKAYAEGGTGSVIDITDFISGDNDILYMRGVTKSANQIGSLQKEKSYIVEVRPFPINVEITAVKTYAKSAAPPSPGNPSAPRSSTETVSIELNSSMVLLPEKPMQARYYDPRVGYFTVG